MSSSNDWDFEEIPEEEFEIQPRGRKSTAPAEIVEAFRKLPAGRGLRIAGLRLDPASSTYATDKARIAARIRSVARAAGRNGVSVKWSPDGVPQVTLT